MLGSFHFFCPSSFSLLHSHGFDSIIFPPWLLFFLCFSDLFLLFYFFLLLCFWLLCSLNYNFTTFLFVLQYFLFFILFVFVFSGVLFSDFVINLAKIRLLFLIICLL